MLTITLNNEAQLAQVAEMMARHLSPGLMIYLHGELGAGKTTLVRGILRALGVTGPVKSPTYTLVELYDIGKRQYCHFDCYRLHDPNEFATSGLDEYCTRDAICFVEWPEHAEGVLPVADIKVVISIIESGRLLTISPVSLVGEAVVHGLEREYKQ